MSSRASLPNMSRRLRRDNRFRLESKDLRFYLARDNILCLRKSGRWPKNNTDARIEKNIEGQSQRINDRDRRHWRWLGHVQSHENHGAWPKSHRPIPERPTQNERPNHQRNGNDQAQHRKTQHPPPKEFLPVHRGYHTAPRSGTPCHRHRAESVASLITAPPLGFSKYTQLCRNLEIPFRSKVAVLVPNSPRGLRLKSAIVTWPR